MLSPRRSELRLRVADRGQTPLRPLRLLFIDFKLPYLLRDSEYAAGGWATQLTGWIAGLAHLGHSVGVLTWKGANAHVGFYADCELVETYDPSRGIRFVKYFASYIPSLLAAARRFAPDVLIQANAGMSTGIMAFIAQRLRRPFVFRVSNDIDVDERCRDHLLGYERLAYRYGLGRASAYLCQNAYQLSRLAETRPRNLLHIIHNPYRIPDSLPDLRPRAERRYVAWLAAMRPFKNLPLLARIASALPDIPFRVAGMPDCTLDPASLAALEILRDLPNAEMLGHVRRGDVPGFLSRAAMLLSTSNYEGFSNTFLESFAAGTPVIARTIVDPDSVIRDRALGLTTPDEDSLASSVLELWKMDVPRFDVLAERCRTYVTANHSPTAKAEELIRIIAPLVAQHA
ncbi:MAG TPA: glycosyltransferase family 4 protein [Rhizomicrobium sp.]|jgi:glycosyltransferase involved in cell wall biosynthesis